MPNALPVPPPTGESVPPPAGLPFYTGQRLDQATFHALAELCPDEVGAELIQGVVIVPPSTSEDHSSTHASVAWGTFQYELETPGVRADNNASVLLGSESEPQPDVALRLLPECGGRTRIVNGFVSGAPELVLEVSVSTEDVDLYRKKRDYQEAGVLEYVVVLVRRERVVWFENRDGQFVERVPDPDGIYRSQGFPGFWLDPEALLQRNGRRLREVLLQGLASPEHATFVTELTARLTAVGSGPLPQ